MTWLTIQDALCSKKSLSVLLVHEQQELQSNAFQVAEWRVQFNGALKGITFVVLAVHEEVGLMSSICIYGLPFYLAPAHSL